MRLFAFALQLSIVGAALLPLFATANADSALKPPEKCWVVESKGWDGQKYSEKKETVFVFEDAEAEPIVLKTTLVPNISVSMSVGPNSAIGGEAALMINVELQDKESGVSSQAYNFFAETSDKTPLNFSVLRYQRANFDSVLVNCSLPKEK